MQTDHDIESACVCMYRGWVCVCVGVGMVVGGGGGVSVGVHPTYVHLTRRRVSRARAGTVPGPHGTHRGPEPPHDLDPRRRRRPLHLMGGERGAVA